MEIYRPLAEEEVDAHKILTNLADVETTLQKVIEDHMDGRYGFITREWGFFAPGGLGGTLGGKFEPWETKLEGVKSFFWPIEAYAAMEKKPYGKPDPEVVKNLPPEAEQLAGNTPLYEYLMQAPRVQVVLEPSDYEDYKSAARIFLLLGTLSHLCGNSSPDRKTCPLPSWIEDPLIDVAKRLDVEPTLTGHFVVQENWKWALTPKEGSDRSLMSKNQIRRFDRAVLKTILTQCTVEDRRYRIKVYHSCFIGSQLVDILLKDEHQYASSREEAVRLARRINARFNLFYHVTGSHPLMDKQLFYRFKKRWRKKLSTAAGTTSTQNEMIDEEIERSEEEATYSGDSKSPGTTDDDDELFGGESTSRVIRPLEFLSRKTSATRNNSLSDSAKLSMHAVRASMLTHAPPERHPSRQTNPGSIVRGLPSSPLGKPERKSSGGSVRSTLSAKPDSFRSLSERALSERAMSERGSSSRAKSTTDDDGSNSSSMKEFMTAIAVMGKVPVKDRRYKFKKYRRCFVGQELIDTLMRNECASTRTEAVTLSRRINQRFDLFEHVAGDHEIKDEYLFFRFTDTVKKMLDIQSDGGEDDSSHLTSTSGVAHRRGSRRRSIDEEAVGAGALLPRPGSVRSESGGSLVGSVASIDRMLGFEYGEEFRLDNIGMLYPAFRNNHERVNQLVPACMGYALRSVPFLILDILAAMYSALETNMQDEDDEDDVESLESRRLAYLLQQLAFCISRCKEQFQLMSTDSTKRGFNSKHVSIRQTQPLSNGVLVRREKGGEPLVAKGVTGTQFPYFHLLDWLLGRHQFDDRAKAGLVAKISAVDDTYPRPQREYILALGNLEKASTLRGVMDALGRPTQLLAAYNHLIECYAGEGGLLQAHSRKLYSYIHNDVQFSTSGTNHLEAKDGKPTKKVSRAADNHAFATMMFKHMRNAADERWRLRVPPLMTEVKKIVYSTSESGGYTTVALDLRDTGLAYEYGDVVKVLLPNDERTTFAWTMSLAKEDKMHFRLDDMLELHKDTGDGWGWKNMWEALGWCKYERDGGLGVPLEIIARYLEQGQVAEEVDKKRWVNSPLDLCGKKDQRLFAFPPKLDLSQILSLEPVSPRIYSVSGVETDRVFLLVSKPQDGARHHGYERMSSSAATTVHCSFTPATAFLVPPKKANLVCIASGTGISPFVGLSDAIGMRSGTTTIVHQCKSSELFLCNSQHWLDFTASNPGACVMGFISGDRSKRNCPMRYVIQNGAFEETTLLGRRSASAYYFECSLLDARVKETYLSDGINLAYCCGGVKSAIQPFKDIAAKKDMTFEFTVECYGVSATLGENSAASQIGGTIVNLDHVSPIHAGGDQILHQLQDVATEKLEPGSGAAADHSVAFWECHPHAYNLHRCLRAPLDGDSEAFAAFLERQVMSQSVMVNMATKYAEVALASPNDSKVVRIATELQASTLRQQIQSQDHEGAVKSANYLQTLLTHVSSQDEDARRWSRLLKEFNALQEEQSDAGTNM